MLHNLQVLYWLRRLSSAWQAFPTIKSALGEDQPFYPCSLWIYGARTALLAQDGQITRHAPVTLSDLAPFQCTVRSTVCIQCATLLSSCYRVGTNLCSTAERGMR